MITDDTGTFSGCITANITDTFYWTESDYDGWDIPGIGSYEPEEKPKKKNPIIFFPKVKMPRFVLFTNPDRIKIQKIPNIKLARSSC